MSVRATRLCLLVAVLSLPAVGCGSRPDGDPTIPRTNVTVLPSPHIPYLGAAHAPYASVPPTSGAHVPQTVAPGVYRQPIPEEIQVHALEHGHVLLQYARGTPAEAIRTLEAIARRHMRSVIVAPYDGIEHGIAMTAWGWLERLERADRAAVERFVLRFANRYDHSWRA